ncbi:MAG TPA: ABC transporter permease [Candidatus Bacteroides pullicola]|uniref:ABC transporter permease n=1 Tax=Candidatus Bacteroides pullicola TaxID=2838475 RepID=A0A9D1ZGM2_9BACE|nr:ABC transporter permease [Candidatus Bacteroides pullicola]
MKTLKYAARHLARAKAYTLINVVGLALSLGCCILLARYLHREYTTDTHCVDRGRVVIPLQDIDGNVYPSILHPDWVTLDTTYITDSQVQERCRLILLQDDLVQRGESSHQAHVLAADSSFFHLFRYPVQVGEAALHAPTDAVLTEAFARRLFGHENPVGQVLDYAGHEVTVRGVIGEPACKTTLHFDLVVAYDLSDEWGRMPWELVHVLPAVDLPAINRQAHIYRPVKAAGDWYPVGKQIRQQFLTLEEFYFDQTSTDEDTRLMRSQGNLRYLHLLAGVAVLLLLVGMLNFVNLYMVLMMKRSKEYGIKKVFGLHRLPLFAQIYTENFLLCAGALLLAGVVVEAGQPLLNRLAGDLIGYTAFDAWLMPGFLVLFPLLASLYPYVRYNYRPPLLSLRTIGTSRQSVTVRMGFLFGQYLVTLLLLVLSVYFVRQLHQWLDTPPGFRTEDIVHVNLKFQSKNYSVGEEQSKAERARMREMANRMKACPYVNQALPVSKDGVLHQGFLSALTNDHGQQVELSTFFVPTGFFDLYGIPVLEGSVEGEGYHMVLNRRAMEMFGYQHREEAFVRSESPLWISVAADGKIMEGGTELMPVTAVVEDYCNGHLSLGRKPMAFIVKDNTGGDEWALSVVPGHERDLHDYLRQTVQEVYHSDDFAFTPLADQVAAIYDDDRRVAWVSTAFALIAIVVSCLGLLGVSLFDLRQRYREIAIRKVNGAKRGDLYRLLFRKYAVILGAAFVVSVPVAWYIVHRYTADFVVRLPLSPWIFLAALAVVALLSLGTLWWQVRRAAGTNPVEALKRE